MSTSIDSLSSGQRTPDATLFPLLTSEQLSRIAAHGRRRSVMQNEVLLEVGGQGSRIFVVTAGQLEAVRPGLRQPDFIASLGPGQFTGEVSALSGRPGFVRVRALVAGEVVEIDREHLLAIVQDDADLSDVLMRAFVLRRAALIARGLGDAVILGSSHCAGTLRIREFLIRNNHPFSEVDLDQEAEIQDLLDRFQVSTADIPVVIFRGRVVLRNPTNRQIADCLGFNESIDLVKSRDLVIVGAGPSGLAAAVYAASEGLDVLVVEASAPGGQAGSSSRIENYLGFPMGISGHDLAANAHAQAQKFGAELMVASVAARLACAARPYSIEMGDRARVPGRAVIIATGARYRTLDIDDAGRFDGSGIYYSATPMEAQLCRDEEVLVVGGGNSAGQAAVFLAQSARRVHMLVRSNGLADTMSRYLIRRIEEHPAIELRLGTRVVGIEGNGHLERVTWREMSSGRTDTHGIRHLFVMAGAIPNTQWLEGCVTLDAKGFVKTGPDLTPEELSAARWPLHRSPWVLETSLPGVFATGDVRSGSLKRVASAVGEGSMAVAMVHRVLHE